jgi:FLVCR family feline leukemia virus subgroup C receptor-related protein
MNAAGWISFSPLFGLLEDKNAYGASLLGVNYMSMSYMIAFAPMFLPSVAVLNKKGLRHGLIVGIGLTTVGLYLRCFININFWMAIIG